MIDQIKAALAGVVLVLLLGLGWYVYSAGKLAGIAEEHVKTVEVETHFAEYRASIADQRKKQQEAIDKLKQEQERKIEKAKSDYQRDTAILGERLRDFEPVLCEGQTPVRMDGDSASGGDKATSTGRVEKATAFATGTKSLAEFYKDAMMDLHQCAKLIEFVQ